MSAPVLREYTHTLPGQGIAYVRIFLPVTVGPADVEDLRAWLALIDRQLERLHTQTQRNAAGIAEYQSWFPQELPT